MEAAFDGNDTQGWVLCIVSGMACVVGASIICVDLLPGMRNFRIQENNTFLAGSLSLSFGVMIFSALYSMLPSSKRYLLEGGWDERRAGFLTMGIFIGGFLGIQVVSRIVHMCIPSHLVDCHHSHHDHTDNPPFEQLEDLKRGGTTSGSQSSRTASAGSAEGRVSHIAGANVEESTPLLAGTAGHGSHVKNLVNTDPTSGGSQSRRSSFPHRVRERVSSFVKDIKADCDGSGLCYGYTGPCGRGCLKYAASRSTHPPKKPSGPVRSTTGSTLAHSSSAIADESEDDDGGTSSSTNPAVQLSREQTHDSETARDTNDAGSHTQHAHHGHTHHHGDSTNPRGQEEDIEAQHHHHVPENAFISIGWQTIITIAIHKFPEGFITYATNHANPSLGFNVFMALFVHNFVEGFSMALPLYLALKKRWSAMVVASVLGGLTQPGGAALAMLLFKFVDRSSFKVGNTFQGCLFGITAGMMTSVALQLFMESVTLSHHNNNLIIGFAVIGMVLLGFSNCLV